MTNEVAPFAGGVPANPEDLESGLQNVQSTLRGSAGGLPFFRLMKSGVYVYGAEDIEMEQGSHWAINPYSLMHGFACWGQGEMLDEQMVPFNQPPPNKASLPDLGFPWEQQVAMQIMCLDGEDAGETALYKGTSTGLRNATKELINQLIAQLQSDKVNIVPVVRFESEWYKHKEYGQIYYPVFDLTQFIPMDDPTLQAAESDTVDAAAADAQAEQEAPVADADSRGDNAQSPSTPRSGNRRRRRRKAG